MLMGKNTYHNPVSKGDRQKHFGDPVCTFKMCQAELRLIISGLLPQQYRPGAWARGGGIDIYFFRQKKKRLYLRTIINSCANIHPPSSVPLRLPPNPVPSVHNGGVDITIPTSGRITTALVSSESELQSRNTPNIDIIAKAKNLPLYLEFEDPSAGDRIHLGGRFWKPFYTQTFLTSIVPQTPILNYGITIHIPFNIEYSQFIKGMLIATN
jgi:hypothetical protein